MSIHSRKMCYLRFSLAFFVSFFIFVLCFGNRGYAASKNNLLSSWQGEVRDKLIAYILEVTKPGHPNFIPEIDRIAVFDMDGTLLTEKPIYFVFDVAIRYMEEHYDKLSSKGPRHKALCDAAKKKDYKYLKRKVEDIFVLPFEGKTYEYYKQYCLKVFETAINPKLKRPLKELVYQPMVELIDLLHSSDFRVFVVSGSLQFCIMAISKKYLHVETNRCIGSMVESHAERRDNAIIFRRGKISLPVNLKEGKAIRIKMRTGKTPVLAFGNSMGDEWMLRFPATSRYRHVSFVIDHDDPREFIYRKDRLIELSRKQNWTVVSMKNHFKRIYAKGN